ncbi:MAG: hypothetical protein ACD_41C00228G0001, partial [uncultured bacterium]
MFIDVFYFVAVSGGCRMAQLTGIAKTDVSRVGIGCGRSVMTGITLTCRADNTPLGVGPGRGFVNRYLSGWRTVAVAVGGCAG